MKKQENPAWGRFLAQQDMARRHGKTLPVPPELKKEYAEAWEAANKKAWEKLAAKPQKKKVTVKPFTHTSNGRSGKVEMIGDTPPPSSGLDSDPLNSLGSKLSQQTAGGPASGSKNCQGVNKDGSPCGNVVVKNSRCQWH